MNGWNRLVTAIPRAPLGQIIAWTAALALCVALAFVPRRLIRRRGAIVVAKVVCAALLATVTIVALRRLSPLLVIPMAATVFALAATALATMPRSCFDDFVQALLRLMPAASRTAASVGDFNRVEALAFGGPSADGASRSTEDSSGPRARRIPRTSVARLFGSASARAHEIQRIRQSMFGARRLANATCKYLTNHLINHIPIHAVRYTWYRRVLGWDLGERASILLGQHIQMAGIRTSGRRVSIGTGTVIHHGCLLSTTGGLIIGENVIIGPGVWLVTGTYLINDPEALDVYFPITIDPYAIIGARATITSGVTIGRGAVVMPGAVVTEDVAPFDVVSGVPAQPIGQRALADPAYSLNYHPPLE